VGASLGPFASGPLYAVAERSTWPFPFNYYFCFLVVILTQVPPQGGRGSQGRPTPPRGSVSNGCWGRMFGRSDGAKAQRCSTASHGRPNLPA